MERELPHQEREEMKIANVFLWFITGFADLPESVIAPWSMLHSECLGGTSSLVDIEKKHKDIVDWVGIRVFKNKSGLRDPHVI